jgi:two-component system sensor histidine kinase QseC
MKTRYSSRRQILLGILASMLLILGGVGWIAKAVSEHETKQVFSARLATSARVLEALVARQLENATISTPIVITLPPELEQPGNDHAPELGHPYENELVFQVWNSEGVLLARSNYAPAERIGPLASGFSTRQANGFLWQVFALESGPIWILAGERDDVRTEIARDISLGIILPLLIGGLLLMFIVNALAMKSIRAVETLSDIIASRDPTSDTPIVARYMPIEIEPVIKGINALLVKVKEAFWREQRFIDSAAHELRTPIAAVQLHLQNALRAELLAERESSLQSALAASRRATKLAEQLLVYSRINAGDAQVEKERINLADVAQGVAAMMQPLLEDQQQHIEFETNTSASLLANKSQIERLIQNLIENAASYGAAPGTIHLIVRHLATRLVLLVENDGESIPAEEKERIFIPYYRVLRKDTSGSGLGLAIVQEIAHQHQAELSVEDKTPGQGTRVAVSFPLG